VSAIRIRVPSPLADTLVADGDAVRPYTTRGPAVSEVLTFAIDGVNTAAAVITLAANVEIYRRFARRLREHAEGHSVSVDSDVGFQRLPLGGDVPDATPDASTFERRSDETVTLEEAVVLVLIAAQRPIDG
jgi:hypothetical protein